MMTFRSGACRALLAAGLGAVTVAVSVAPAAAQEFPVRPLRIVVPDASGTSTDAAARLLATAMQASLGQPVAVENKPGARGTTGIETVARSAPDGYTLGIADVATMVLLPALDPKLPYQPFRDLAVVGVATSTALVFVARSGLPVKSLPELVHDAQSRPGKVKFASPDGGLAQFSFKLLQARAHIKLAHAPAADDAAALEDLLAGRADVGLLPALVALPQVKSGKLTALAFAGPQRSRQWPDLPTAAEASLPGYAASQWTVLVAPAGTHPVVIQKLNAALNAALRDPALAGKLGALGMTPSPFSVGQTRDILSAENSKWSRMIKEEKLTLAK